MSKIGRYASMAVFVLALAEAIAQWNGHGFLFLFREKQAAFTYLFSVGFFMTAGFAYLIRRAKMATLFVLLGVLFAARAGFTVPEGGKLPWCTEPNASTAHC